MKLRLINLTEKQKAILKSCQEAREEVKKWPKWKRTFGLCDILR